MWQRWDSSPFLPGGGYPQAAGEAPSGGGGGAVSRCLCERHSPAVTATGCRAGGLAPPEWEGLRPQQAHFRERPLLSPSSVSQDVKARESDRVTVVPTCGPCVSGLHTVGSSEMSVSFTLLPPPHLGPPQCHMPYHLPRQAVLEEDSSAFWKVPPQVEPTPVELPRRCPQGTGGTQLPVVAI